MVVQNTEHIKCKYCGHIIKIDNKEKTTCEKCHMIVYKNPLVEFNQLMKEALEKEKIRIEVSKW